VRADVPNGGDARVGEEAGEEERFVVEAGWGDCVSVREGIGGGDRVGEEGKRYTIIAADDNAERLGLGSAAIFVGKCGEREQGALLV
jgi:hypothetical protein